MKRKQPWVNKICYFSVLNRTGVKSYIITVLGALGVPTPSTESGSFPRSSTEQEDPILLGSFVVKLLSNLAMFCFAFSNNNDNHNNNNKKIMDP